MRFRTLLSYQINRACVTLRGLIFAKINFREFREFCLNSRKYVFAKYLNFTNSRKFVFAKYLNNKNSRKFTFAKYSKNCRFAKINPRFFPEGKLSARDGDDEEDWIDENDADANIFDTSDDEDDL